LKLLKAAEKLVGMKELGLSFGVDRMPAYKTVLEERRAVFVAAVLEEVIRPCWPQLTKELGGGAAGIRGTFPTSSGKCSGMDREVDAHGSHLCKSNSGKDTWS